MKKTYAYHAYLIRLWQEDAHSPWRATLEDPHTGERKGFADLDSLITYLKTQTDPTTPPAEPTQLLD
jgi:hypothetical protein